MLQVVANVDLQETKIPTSCEEGKVDNCHSKWSLHSKREIEVHSSRGSEIQ